MSEVFEPDMKSWSYKAIVPDVLRSTKLPLPPAEHARVAFPRHSAAYWTKSMANQDFSGPDRIDAATFNRAVAGPQGRHVLSRHAGGGRSVGEPDATPAKSA
jgi:hypothetical protein